MAATQSDEIAGICTYEYRKRERRGKTSAWDKRRWREILIEKIIGRKIGSFSVMPFEIHYGIMIMVMIIIMWDYSLILMKRNFLDDADLLA